jgi:hypothetical protein
MPIKVKPLPPIEIVRALLNYDRDTGSFSWKERGGRATPWDARYAGTAAGTINHDGYIRIGIKGNYYVAHRLAWLIVHGLDPATELDHINGNRADNRIDNLRLSSRDIQQQNCIRSNKTGLTGVYRTAGGRFGAVIQVNYKAIYLGTFDLASDAYISYLSAKKQYHPFNPVPRPMLDTKIEEQLENALVPQSPPPQFR